VSRPAWEVADIFRDHGPAWRSANAGHVSLGQLKVMSAIESCRTAALGGHVARCENQNCGKKSNASAIKSLEVDDPLGENPVVATQQNGGLTTQAAIVGSTRSPAHDGVEERRLHCGCSSLDSTGSEFEANKDTYTAQVALYADAIGKATNLPTRGILFVV
jgi:hypothetical protein